MVPAWLDPAPGRVTFLADSARHSQLLPTPRQEASVPKRQGADVRRLPGDLLLTGKGDASSPTRCWTGFDIVL